MSYFLWTIFQSVATVSELNCDQLLPDESDCSVRLKAAFATKEPDHSVGDDNVCLENEEHLTGMFVKNLASFFLRLQAKYLILVSTI